MAELDQDLQTEDENDGQEQSGKRRIKRWTSAEHELLVRLVEQLGEDACWATIAEHIPGRSGKQCRERWVNHIGADIKKGGWSTEEEAQVARLHATIGPAWTRIANALGGRTENSVKNHFNALLRSKRLDDKKTSVLAQYVRLVRDKIVTGPAAYEQAVRAMQNAVGSPGNSSQPSGKSRGQRASQQASHGSGNEGRSSGRQPGSAGAGIGDGGAPGNGMQPIHTKRMMGSPGDPSYSSAANPGAPASGTPMSGAGMGDASAALTAAAQAVQAATNAVAGVTGSGGNSEGAAEYSWGSPGQPLGSAPTQSVSMSASLGTLADDQFALRGMRRTGRGGRGRPGYGHMPTLRDARSGGTPTAQTTAQAQLALVDGAQWQSTSLDMGAGGSQASHPNPPHTTPVCGSAAPYTPVSNRKVRDDSNAMHHQGGWMSDLGSPANMLHAASQQVGYGNGHMGQHMGLPSNSGQNLNQYNGMPIGTVQMTSAIQEQVAQLTGMLVRPGGVGGSGSMDPGAGHNHNVVHTLGGGVLMHHGSWGSQSFNPPPMSHMDGHGRGATSMHMVMAHPNMMPPGAQMSNGQGDQGQGAAHRHNTRHEGRGTSNHDQPGIGDSMGAPLGMQPMGVDMGTSANSLTLGMNDLVGHTVYNSVFGNQQNIDIGSPMSPASRNMVGRMSGPLGVPLFSQFPSHASYDFVTTVPDNDQPIVGRLSGLSLEQMLASPVSARTPSASALYFLQGAQAMRSSRPDGLATTSSQHQVLLGPSYSQNRQGQLEHGGGMAAATGKPSLQHGGGPGSLPTGRPPLPPNGITDDLGLVMKPLHVKTRKGQGSDQTGVANGPNDALANRSAVAINTNKIPVSYVASVGANGGPGMNPSSIHQLLFQDGTPTARMLGDVFLTWTQEPNTPSNMLVSSPQYPVMQHVLQGPIMSSHQIGMAGGQDNMYGPNTSFLHVQSEDVTTPHNPSGIPQVSVPAPEDMACLDIVFDDSGAPAEPLAQGSGQQQQAWQDAGQRGASDGGGRGQQQMKEERLEPFAAKGVQQLGYRVSQDQELGPRSPPSQLGGSMARVSTGPASPGSQQPAAAAPAHPSPATKRSSVHMWGDSYSPGHSAAKRLATHHQSCPGTGPGHDGAGMQHSADSSGTPLPLPPSSPAGSGDQLAKHNSLAWASMQHKQHAANMMGTPSSGMHDHTLGPYTNGGRWSKPQTRLAMWEMELDAGMAGGYPGQGRGPTGAFSPRQHLVHESVRDMAGAAGAMGPPPMAHQEQRVAHV